MASRSQSRHPAGQANDGGEQGHAASLSATCRSADLGTVSAAAEIVDAVEAMASQERTQEALEIFQGIDTIAFSRSQVLLQVDTTKRWREARTAPGCS